MIYIEFKEDNPKYFYNQYLLTDLIDLINNTTEAEELVFRSDGMAHLFYLEDKLVATILPCIDKEDKLYNPGLDEVVDDDLLSEEGFLTDRLQLKRYWLTTLYKLLFKNNHLLSSFIIPKVHYQANKDGIELTFVLSRTPNWTKEVPYVHPVMYYFNRILDRSCTSGTVKLLESIELDEDTFNISMSNGNHSASVHPSKADSYLIWHNDYCINHFRFYSEFFGLGAKLIESFGTDSVFHMFGSWHHHEFQVEIPYDKIMKEYLNIDSETYYYKDEKYKKSHVPLTFHWDGKPFKFERILKGNRDEDVFNDEEIARANEIIKKINKGLVC